MPALQTGHPHDRTGQPPSEIIWIRRCFVHGNVIGHSAFLHGWPAGDGVRPFYGHQYEHVRPPHVFVHGAKSVECIAAMLMFNVFTYFTVYSQLHVMKIKSFTFFPGVRLAIPILITIALAALNPFIGIVFFVFTFLMEIFAKIYKEMDAKSRPTKGKIGQMVVLAAVLVTIGTALVQFIPENYYYIVGGVTILIFALFMWDKLLYASTFLTGLSGIDGTDWLTAMRRNPESVLSKCYPIVINGAMIIALLASYAMYQYFSLGALFATIGSAVGIRLFGLYEHKEKGSFSYLTLGIAVLAALVFMIIQPVPTGFPVLPMADNAGFFDF